MPLRWQASNKELMASTLSPSFIIVFIFSMASHEQEESVGYERGRPLLHLRRLARRSKSPFHASSRRSVEFLQRGAQGSTTDRPSWATTCHTIHATAPSAVKTRITVPCHDEPILGHAKDPQYHALKGPRSPIYPNDNRVYVRSLR